jgi:serine phosphatase RsbU (regulator of sigma subunit)/predicted ester cyclase
MSVEEENKALSRRVAEAINRGDLEAFDELFAPDLVPEWKRDLAEIKRAFPDYHGADEFQIAEGDLVAGRLVFHGTHQGEFMGLAPTGEQWTFEGLSAIRVRDGKIVEDWVEINLEDKWQQRLDQELREREQVEQELQVARGIQQASLPKAMPKLEGWQIDPFYRPAREVGGDFYDFHPLSEGRLGVVVGDATGKGVPAALVMSTTLGMLQLAAQAPESSSPGEVLSRVNETLVARIPPNMFVTCFYAILDPKSGTLSYANAGHTLPCCKRHDEDQTDELRVRGMPLGLMPGMLYEEKETILEPGDGVLLCTDGLVEAHNPQGEMFGTPRLRDILSERSEGGNGLSAALMEELESFTGEGGEQEDDITLLTLKRSASLS